MSNRPSTELINRVGNFQRDQLRPLRLHMANFIVVGGYQDLVRRSFETQVSSDALELLAEDTKDGRNISMSSLRRVAGDILKPSTDYENYVGISDGWKAPRFRFTLEFHQETMGGTVKRYIYVGYTNHVGANLDGAMDEEMELNITAVIVLLDTFTLGRRGRERQTSLISFEQVLVSDIAQAQGYRSVRGLEGEYSMAPVDVFYHVQSVDAFGDFEGDQVFQGDSIVSAQPRFARRLNTVPSNYMSTLLNSAKYGESNAMDLHLQGDGAVYDNIISQAQEGQISRDPLFHLFRKGTDIYTGAVIRWVEILDAFPEAEDDDVLFLSFPGEARIGHESLEGALDHYMDARADEVDEWGNFRMETVIATQIAQQLPSFMMSELIVDIHFTITNQARSFIEDGYHWLFNHGGDPTDSVHFVVDGLPADLQEQLVANFQQKFSAFLMDGITMDNSIPVSLRIDSTADGETNIVLSLDGGEERYYSYPMHADNRASPIITSRHEHYQKVCGDLIGVQRNIGF